MDGPGLLQVCLLIAALAFCVLRLAVGGGWGKAGWGGVKNFVFRC